jgi:hypothetical protein
MKMLLEHKESCEVLGRECCDETKFIKLKLAPLSEYGIIDEEEL